MKVKVYQWLRGDGNAYLNTKLKPSASLEYEVEAQITYTDVRDECLFGARDDSNGRNDYIAWMGTPSVNPQISFRYNDYSNDVNVIINNEPQTITYKNGSLFLNDTLAHKYSENVNRVPDLPLYLFALNVRNVYADLRRFTGRVAYFKTDTLHLVPCLTSDNEACMLDLLSGDLYRNQGPGAFSVEGECLYELETPAISRMMRKPSIVVRMREWLVGGYRCRIDTGISYNIYTDALYMSFRDNYGKNRTSKLNSEGKEEYIFGAIKDINSSFQNGFRAYFSGIYALGMPLGKGSLTWTNFLVSTQNNENYNIRIGNVIGNSYRISGDCDGESVDKYFNAEGEIDEIYPNISIFGSNTSVSNWSNVSFKSFKIERNGATILELHPCDILYHPTLPPQSAMIDPYTGQLYTNQGTGNFTCEGEDLGIWTDTMFDDMRIKDVKADMVCVMQDGEPRVVWERTQPWVEHKWLKGDGVDR